MKIKKLKLKPCLEKNMKGDGGDCPIWWGGGSCLHFLVKSFNIFVFEFPKIKSNWIVMTYDDL